MDIRDYLSQLGGAARTAQLLAAGYTRTDLARLAGTGAGVEKPRRGVFMLPDCKPEIAAAIRHSARVTCASAAPFYGLWLKDAPLQHHLACNHGYGRGFIRHRTTRFEGDPTLPLAGLEDVVLHALACLPTPASTAIATSAMRLHGVPMDLLKSQLKADKSGPSRAVLRQLDLRAESIVEVDAHYLFRTNGLDFETQVQLPGIGRVDFLIEGCLIVEVDGLHSTPAARPCVRTSAATTPQH